MRLAQQNAKLNASAVNPNSAAIAESKIKQAQDRVNAIDAQANLAEDSRADFRRRDRPVSI